MSDATINLNISTNNNGKIKDIIQDSGSSLCDLITKDEKLKCNNEGKSNISVTITNVSGKSAKWSSDLNIDKTAPNIENVALWSQNSSYNSNDTYGSFKITDNISGIYNVTSNVPNNQGVTSWNKKGLLEWNVTGYKGKAANSLNGASVTMHITATDIAGNESNANSNNYKIYKECSTTNSNSKYSGSCTNNGYRTNNTSVVDVNTGKSCSSTSTKVDCSISDIAVMLNTADAKRTDNPGMSGIEPVGTRSKKGIFDCDGSYDYDNRFKRGINSITLNVDEDATLDEQWSVAWSHNWMTYAGSACMNVGDFERRLVYRIKWNDGTYSNYIYTKVKTGFDTSDYTSKLFTGRKDKGIQIKINEDNSYLVNRDCKESDLSAGVKAETCGSVDTSTPNLTKHVYYLSYGSVSSNRLTIYTKYFRSY